MAKCMQCGGPTKMKKMAKGGSAEIVGMPKYGNNPRTSTGAMLKKGGSVKKYQDGGPVAAMQKAMGQKPVSTKKTMKYVRKKGSGYIPPTESNKPDTSKWAEKQASPNAKKMQKGGTNSVVIRKAKSTDPYPMTLEGLEMKKKGLEMKHNGMQMKLKGEAMKKMPEKIVQTNKMAKGGSVAKAKFGATVAVQRSPKSGKVTGVDGGYAKVGQREPARNKFAKGGFPDLNKDGKITKADILKGRGVIKRKGGAIKKK
jgi:hypothetical protein